MTDRKPLEGPAAIEATYATYRPVPSRGVFQVVCELPIEKAEHALEALGQPGFAGKQVWVAIALLNKATATGECREAPKPKRDKLMSERLALACKDEAFWGHLNTLWSGYCVKSERAADAHLKDWLGIQSKTECDVPGEKQDAATRLLDAYELKRNYSGNLEREAGKHG